MPMSAPLPPIPPDDGICCGSGCTPCVWDFYYEELANYRLELAQWQAEQAATAISAESSDPAPPPP